MTKYVVSLKALVENYHTLSRLSHSLVIPMLKADFYGLGAERAFCALKDAGVSLFAVSRIEEALPLAGRGAEILVTSCYHGAEDIKAIVDNDLTAAVDSVGQAKRLSEYALSQGKTVRVHIAVDTGFGRFGFLPDNLSDMLEIYKIKGLAPVGIFSHFSESFNADRPTTDIQLERFLAVIAGITENGYDVGLRHIANSCAMLRDEKYRLDACRVGSALLGRLPMRTDVPLTRLGSFETEIVDIRRLKKGANIGYGNVFTLKSNARVAVVCCGSADGVLIKKDYDTYRFADILRYGFGVFKMLFRDNRPTVTVNGKTARLIGRVALTHSFVDVTDIDCKVGDTVRFDISPLYSRVMREYTDV